jgi:pimeloyl-ACP methyl ester carboxylesterase
MLSGRKARIYKKTDTFWASRTRLMNNQTLNIKSAGSTYEVSACYRSASQDLIFFLHGLGCAKDTFSKAWDDNNFKEYSLLSIDFLGFGHSAKPDEFSYSIEDHAKVCESVLRHFPEKRLHVVGHSMGAAIGLLLSDDFLNSAISFVNIEGNLIGEDCGYISRKAVSVPYNTFEEKLFPDFKSLLESEKNRHFSLDIASTLAFYRSSKSLVTWSDSRKLLGRFKNLKCKKAYFYGDQNSGMKILADLDDIEKIMISKSGHFPTNDNPSEFYSKLHEFLSLSMTF